MSRGPIAIAGTAFLLHAVQGLLLPTPWLLPDEVHAADAARAGAGDGFPSLWAVVTAPFWAIGTDVGYEAAKLLGAVAVAATALPAHRLARTVLSERFALGVAALATLAPGSVLASTAHPAAAAYPVGTAATLALVTERGRALALGALSVLLWPPLLLVAAPVAVHELVRRLGRRGVLEWPGAALLVAVPAVGYAVLAGGRLASDAFRRATDAWLDVPLAGAASIGAFALGLAVAPVVFAVAAAVADPVTRRSRLWRVLVVELAALVVLAALLGLGRSGGGRVTDEVALLFAIPLVATLAAAALGRVDRRSAAIAVAAVGTAILLVPAGTDRHAPGLALADALRLHPVVYALSLALLAANLLVASRLLPGRMRPAPAVAAAVLALAFAGEAAAWLRARDVPRTVSVEEVAGGRPVTVVGQASPDELAGFLFWTPSAAVAHPPLESRDVDPQTGLFEPSLPGGLVFDFRGARVAGTVVAVTADGTLIDAGAVARAAETIEGLYSDSWSSGDTYYRRFGGTGRAGVLLVTVSRAAWRGPSPRSQVVLTSRPLNGEPYAERITSIRSGEQRLVELPVPAPPFEAKIAIGPTFSPADHGGTDQRRLGAQLTFDYRPG